MSAWTTSTELKLEREGAWSEIAWPFRTTMAPSWIAISKSPALAGCHAEPRSPEGVLRPRLSLYSNFNRIT
jgi:hypothetical protein